MSHTVAYGTREIGIRMALGAARKSVLWLVLRDVAAMSIIGVALGLPAALGLGRFIESQLFGLPAADPLTLGLASAALIAVALFSGYLPASRAARIAATSALRFG